MWMDGLRFKRAGLKTLEKMAMLRPRRLLESANERGGEGSIHASWNRIFSLTPMKGQRKDQTAQCLLWFKL
jgi:hypothetical protein